MTTDSFTRRTTGRLAMTALVTGGVAALLTTTLSFLSLALAVVTAVVGWLALRRGQSPTPIAAGIAMAGVSAYVIVLEILVLGG